MPLNIDFQQVLLHLFNFVVLFGGLYFLLYKPIRAFMDKREGTYSNMQEKATKALAEAEALKQEYQEKLNGIELWEEFRRGFRVGAQLMAEMMEDAEE